MQVAGKTQIVARLMVEELAFYGIRNAQDVATCLNGYDQTAYPEGSQWSFTRFYLPQAFDAGYRLVSDADTLERIRDDGPQGQSAGGAWDSDGGFRTRARDSAQGQAQKWTRTPYAKRCWITPRPC